MGLEVVNVVEDMLLLSRVTLLPGLVKEPGKLGQILVVFSTNLKSLLSSLASACFRKVYISAMRAGTAVFSCIDWSGRGPNSDLEIMEGENKVNSYLMAAIIHPDR